MPYSAKTFDDIIAERLADLQLKECLDIGAGSGKYGKIIKHVCPTTKVTAIEAFEPNLSRFNLNSIYDKVWITTASDFLSQNSMIFDCTILGDVIEHMPKSEGLDVLNYLSYYSRDVFIVYPINWFQDTMHGNTFERHISRWDLSDFSSIGDVQFYIKKDLGRNRYLSFIHLKFYF